MQTRNRKAVNAERGRIVSRRDNRPVARSKLTMAGAEPSSLTDLCRVMLI